MKLTSLFLFLLLLPFFFFFERQTDRDRESSHTSQMQTQGQYWSQELNPGLPDGWQDQLLQLSPAASEALHCQEAGSLSWVLHPCTPMWNAGIYTGNLASGRNDFSLSFSLNKKKTSLFSMCLAYLLYEFHLKILGCFCL